MVNYPNNQDLKYITWKCIGAILHGRIYADERTLSLNKMNLFFFLALSYILKTRKYSNFYF